MANRLLYYDDVEERVVRSTKDPANVPDSGGSATIVVGRETLTNGSTTKVVTISPAMADTTYATSLTLVNTTDSSPTLQPMVITSRSTSSFTVKWNTPLDTSNYELEWMTIRV